MIEIMQGNLFESGADAIVCPVNCVGAMGKGLALAFAERFPKLNNFHKNLCEQHELFPGRVIASDFEDRSHKIETIVLLPTKLHWKNPSRPSYVLSGLGELALWLDERNDIHSIAVPALGCGLGGLPWDRVLPMIELTASLFPERRWLVFPPKDGPR